ncbi:unnamed protein product [Rhizopus stolonifer]
MHSRRHTHVLQKSSSSTQKLYKEAYTQACKAIQHDTNARYPEAKEAYLVVIKNFTEILQQNDMDSNNDKLTQKLKEYQH